MRQRPYVACEAKNISHLVLYRCVLTPVLGQPDEIADDLAYKNHTCECLIGGHLSMWYVGTGLIDNHLLSTSCPLLQGSGLPISHMFLLIANP